jgi:hypothetical protein
MWDFSKKNDLADFFYPANGVAGVRSFFVDNRQVTRYIPWLSSWFARAGITQW